MQEQNIKTIITYFFITVLSLLFTIFLFNSTYLSILLKTLFSILILVVTTISILFIKIVKNDKQKDRQILKLNQELKEKDQFMVITQHQLRTPLTAFKWGLEMLLNGDFGAITHAQEDYFKEAKSNNERLIDIANKMVEYSDANKTENILIHADFKNVFNKAYLNLKVYIQKKKIDLRVDDTFDNTKKLEISEEKLYQIIYNLVDNAIKYSKIGGVIESKVYREGNNLVFIIKDSGIGISQEEVNSLFKRFFRAKNAINSHPEGSGLGLFISKTIIDQVKGSIDCTSEGINKGTVFTIKIPLKVDEKR